MSIGNEKIFFGVFDDFFNAMEKGRKVETFVAMCVGESVVRLVLNEHGMQVYDIWKYTALFI